MHTDSWTLCCNSISGIVTTAWCSGEIVHVWLTVPGFDPLLCALVFYLWEKHARFCLGSVGNKLVWGHPFHIPPPPEQRHVFCISMGSEYRLIGGKYS